METPQVRYCRKCLGNNITSYDLTNPITKCTFPMKFYTFYHGFVANEFATKCPICNNNLVEMTLTIDEWKYITKTSLDQNFIFAMDKLKQDNIIDFNIKMSQFKQSADTISLAQIQAQNISKPKCPTCNSINISKISGTKRWVSTGLFGIASSNVGKTMQCNNCGYKW